MHTEVLYLTRRKKKLVNFSILRLKQGMLMLCLIMLVCVGMGLEGKRTKTTHIIILMKH